MITDMTKGKIAPVLIRFTVPLLISAVFQQVYNLADSIIAGRYIGETAMSAIGNAYEVTLLFMAFAFGCNIGTSVIISQLFGARRYAEVKTAVGTTYIASAALSLILTVFGVLSCNGLLRLIGTPADIFSDSGVYLDIYIYGVIFLFVYNISNGIFTALGDSKTPLIFLIFSSVGNIFLDIVFVTRLGMGVDGIAWATFLAQGVSCILSVAVLFARLKKIPHDKGERPKLFSFSMLKKISVVAVPSIIQQSFISVGNIMIQSVINRFGSGVIAGYSASIKLNNFAIVSFSTFANGVSSFCAQNIGAGNLERIKKGFRVSLAIAFAVAFPFVLIYILFPRMLVSLFLENPSEDAIRSSMEFLRIVAPFYFVIALKFVSDGVLRGARAMRLFMVSTFLDLIIRIGLCFFLPELFGTVGIWSAWPVGWLAGALASLIFYKSGMWKKALSVQNL